MRTAYRLAPPAVFFDYPLNLQKLHVLIIRIVRIFVKGFLSVLFSVAEEIHESVGGDTVNGRVYFERPEVVLPLGDKQGA